MGDTKALSDAEAKDRASLLTKYKMMSTDLENMREKLENEAMRKSDALKALSKSQAEIQLWKSRFETEGMGRIEELEGARNKLQSKIVENEELEGALEEAEATLEMEENRVLRSQLELANVRQEIDRRVAEKEEEFNNTRKNHARA